jgi:hypothetical protein
MKAPGEPAREPNKRVLWIALFVVATVGFAIGLTSYLRYAAVWLRKPPRMPQCVVMTRQGLMREEPISGSIPRLLPDGSTVYLRKSEDRAVQCVDRVSSEASKRLAAAFAETNPGPRAKGLLSVVRDQTSKDPSADAEALAMYLMAAASIRGLPPSEEVNAAKDELDQLNACRFAMRSQCPTRPPMPLVVWIAGVPSSVVLLGFIGVGLGQVGRSLRGRWRKRKAAKKAAKEAAP